MWSIWPKEQNSSAKNSNGNKIRNKIQILVHLKTTKILISSKLCIIRTNNNVNPISTGRTDK